MRNEGEEEGKEQWGGKEKGMGKWKEEEKKKGEGVGE